MPSFRHLLCAALVLLPLTHAASAAESPKSFFGVELGARFAIPSCDRGEDTMTGRLCHAPQLKRSTPWGGDEYHVFYPRSGSVPYPRGEMLVDVVDGLIEAVHINTWGIEAQGPAMDALKLKYGPPAKQRSEKIRALRSRTPSVFADWEMKDYSVKYDGTTTTIDWGRITLATHRHRQIVHRQHGDGHCVAVAQRYTGAVGA